MSINLLRNVLFLVVVKKVKCLVHGPFLVCLDHYLSSKSIKPYYVLYASCMPEFVSVLVKGTTSGIGWLFGLVSKKYAHPKLEIDIEQWSRQQSD